MAVLPKLVIQNAATFFWHIYSIRAVLPGGNSAFPAVLVFARISLSELSIGN
jgi:hypothetical protein